MSLAAIACLLVLVTAAAALPPAVEANKIKIDDDNNKKAGDFRDAIKSMFASFRMPFPIRIPNPEGLFGHAMARKEGQGAPRRSYFKMTNTDAEDLGQGQGWFCLGMAVNIALMDLLLLGWLAAKAKSWWCQRRRRRRTTDNDDYKEKIIPTVVNHYV